LGWDAKAFSEIEPFPSAVLTHRFPDVPNLGDMTKYKGWNLGAIDLLVGGTPCQSFSVAGLRKGMDDPRGNLALVFLGILERFKPRWMVWENVPGVLSSNKGRDFGAFLGALAELGYGWAYRVLDAQFFGVPQRRRRVFVIGYFGDWRRAAAVLFERYSVSGYPAPSRKAGEEIAGTIGSRSSAGGGLGTDFDLAGGLQVHDMRGNGDGETVNALAGDHAGRPTDYSPVISKAVNAKGGSGRMDY
jgi:DNA (cytosine-5)-methyltransferase 1